MVEFAALLAIVVLLPLAIVNIRRWILGSAFLLSIVTEGNEERIKARLQSFTTWAISLVVGALLVAGIAYGITQIKLSNCETLPANIRVLGPDGPTSVDRKTAERGLISGTYAPIGHDVQIVRYGRETGKVNASRLSIAHDDGWVLADERYACEARVHRESWF